MGRTNTGHPGITRGSAGGYQLTLPNTYPCPAGWHPKQVSHPGGGNRGPCLSFPASTALRTILAIQEATLAGFDPAIPELPALSFPTQAIRKVAVKVRGTCQHQVSRRVKAWYDGKCQVIACPSTKWCHFVEGAHIIALAHGGPYDTDNFLCLCPNHHRNFDAGLLIGSIRVDPRHHPERFLPPGVVNI